MDQMPFPRQPAGSLFRLATLAAGLCFTVSAHAASLINDGGFESASGGSFIYAGSSIDGGSWNVTSGGVYIDSGDPYVRTGNNSLNLTGINPDAPNTIAQTLNTVAGQTYLVNFFANADSTNLFSLLENGLVVLGAPTSIANKGFPGAVTNSALFTAYAGSFTASSGLTTLSFTGTSVPPIGSQLGSVVLDDISIVATPEPQSLILVLTGIGGLVETFRRKRR